MRLEKKKQQELDRRSGLTKRTVAFVIWLILSFIVAYFLTEFLFSEGYLSTRLFYRDLRIPNEIPETGLKLMTMFVIVICMQIIFYVGYFFASPEGRRAEI